jgi:hypothetical protein
MEKSTSNGSPTTARSIPSLFTPQFVKRRHYQKEHQTKKPTIFKKRRRTLNHFTSLFILSGQKTTSGRPPQKRAPAGGLSVH